MVYQHSSFSPYPPERYEFASDNTAGLVPEALASLMEANNGFRASYGEDSHTKAATKAVQKLFERPCEVFFVSTGTAANSLALAQLCRSHHGIICHETAHIQTDECGAPEFFIGGGKLITGAGQNGKLTPAIVINLVSSRRDVHSSKPRVLSLTIPTEHGTVYSLEELRILRDTARQHNLLIHLDGARFANAAASLDCSPAEIIEASGADVLCFGGTKCGLGLSEAVVFFNLKTAEEFDYRCKQAGQLASKMRFFSAPWATMLESGLWLRYAQAANESAQLLASELADLGITPQFPVEANTVFVNLKPEVEASLHEKGWHFHRFFDGAARFMCSWKVNRTTIEELIVDFKAALNA